MMKGLNKVTLIGNLGKDVEFNTLSDGISVAKFSLATSESYRDKQGQIKTETEWHSIVLWQKLAELAHKYLKKGSSIYLEGKIKTRNYEDKTGVKRYVTEIIGDQLLMLDRTENTDTAKADIDATPKNPFG